MELDSRAEEILESLWKATEEESLPFVLLEGLGLQPSDPSLCLLLGMRFVSLEGGRLRLEEEGRKEAHSTVRRHRLAERLMADVFDLKGPLIDEPACRFEHLLHRGIEERICTLLGHPKRCPHGQPIPPGPCCLERQKSELKLVSPMTDLHAGQCGKIAYLHVEDAPQMQKLMAMGVLPGTPVTLLQRLPSYIFQARYSQFAIDADMARGIYVRIEDRAGEPPRTVTSRPRRLRRRLRLPWTRGSTTP